MAKAKTPPPVAVAERPQYAEPQIPLPDPPPQYATADASDYGDPSTSEIAQIAKDASYMLLAPRAQEWQLLAFGNLCGANLRSFVTMDEGVAFVKACGITNCRCLELPAGVIQ